MGAAYRMSAFGEIVSGLLGRRPAYLQVGALCLRKRDGAVQVLLISSRGTGRWIIPKGWPMRGRSLAGAARQEAWEEAGIKGKVAPDPCGSYHYDKGLDQGGAIRVEVLVYKLKTESLAERYPEAGQRRRRWFSPSEAAERVDEPGLKAILLGL